MNWVIKVTDINDQLLTQLFQEQRDHIDTRISEVKEKVKDLKEDVCDLKCQKKKQLIIAGITGLLGGAIMVVLNYVTGGGIFNVIPKP
jgi:hypothetical protein